MTQKFGKLTVIERVEPPKHLKDKKSIYLLCKCDCGGEKVVRKSSLLSGATISCGCERKNNASKMGKNAKTHGLSDTRFYRIWYYMRRRCNDENYNEYHNYGGRGIKVSESWQTFENFMNDMYDSYIEFEKEHGENSASLDRLDSDKDYCKDNCRWATDLEQARNREGNISVVVDGVEYATLTELAEAYKIDNQLVWSRYRAGKRDRELVVDKKRTHKGKNTRGIEVEVNGKHYESLAELQRDYDYISLVTISKRYKQGKRGEELIKPPHNRKIR